MDEKAQYIERLRRFFDSIICERVEHFSYGEGYIESFDSDIVFVKFDDSDHLRRFKMESFFLFNSPMNGELLSEFECIKFEYEQALKQKQAKKEEKAKKVEEPEKVKNYINNVKFEDVIGLDNVKDTVNKLIIYPFKYQDIYRAFKRESGGGILLYGAPGCGKTMIVKAIANEVDAELFIIKCSDIKSKWYGESETRIKQIFEEARKYPKSIIFFDEFDSLGQNRDDSQSRAGNGVVAELLTQIDGFDSKIENNTIMVIAATNKPWNIDSALLRSGRFGKKIYVGLPKKEEVIEIIKHELVGLPVSNINFEEISNNLKIMSSADVVALCNEVKDRAITRSIELNRVDSINTDDFVESMSIIRPTVNLEELKRLEKFVI